MTKILNINPENIKTIFNNENYKIIDFSFPSISFDPKESSDFNIDSFICKRVINEISKIECDLIVIPVSLTVNFLEFVGLRLAYHIRLTSTQNQYKPIIFLSDINLNELLKLNDLCEILYANGSYLLKTNEAELVALIETGKLRDLSQNDFKIFVNKINFSSPENYLSNHSIANEWGISRWAGVLKVSDEKITQVKENVESLLYFKYLQNKYPPSITIVSNYLCSGRGKVVYIDDEWNKGWKTVLEKFFSFSQQIDFSVLEENFKDKTSCDIERIVKDFIISENPDLIILDLRLNDNDFTHNTLKLFTGYKILEAIKALNPGYQIIIFSATSKIWNLLELQKNGANGFILKEAPELNVETNYAKKSIEFLKKHVEKALSKTKHRSIWQLMQKAKNATNYSNSNYISESAISIEIAWGLMVSGNLNYAYLSLYQAIEKYGESEWRSSDNSMIESSGALIKIIEITSPAPAYSSTWMLKYVFNRTGSYFKIENVIITQEEKISALVQVSAVCAFRLGKDDVYLQKIGMLNQLRNDIAHRGKQLNSYTEIEELLNLLYEIRNTNI
ncbi:response regulator [Flavobacterium granuli]|uniref:CheY-like chemotaxis protein n=1 Tax=Flavobacterium granuli TaxID=280093 RepID=A0ABU1S401_9FLAO|nr:response regulator [Flavobacterium granuli]MDR6845667.1 CheY-like chemotaxis protein [Flavobacterium granuli]